MVKIALGIACLCPLLLAAQPKIDRLPFGGFQIVTLKYQFAPKWSATAETQLRSARFGRNYFYYEYKAGVGYDLPNKTQAFVGIGRFTTFDPNSVEDFSGPVIREYRSWQQFTVNNNIGQRLRLDHRFRVEQRFFESVAYRNRFRYRLNMAYPINHLLMEDNTIFLNAYNEIFLNNRLPHFERNRLYVGGGFEFNKYITLLAGILNQYDYSFSQRLSRNFIQTSILISLKSGEVRKGVPQAVD